jgi:predicted PurR-regulated permease PerM
MSPIHKPSSPRRIAPDAKPANASPAPASPSSPSRNSRAATRIVIAAVALAAVIALIVLLNDILTPFVAGALLAYLGSPIVERLDHPKKLKFHVPRSLGALIVLLALLVIVSAIAVILIPLIQTEIGAMAAQLPQWFDHISKDVLPRVESLTGVSLSADWTQWRGAVAGELSRHLGSVSTISLSVLTHLKDSGAAFFAFLVNLALIPVVMFYLLRDWNKFVAAIDGLIPRRWHAKTAEIAHDIDGVLAEFLRGQALVMLCLCVYYSLLLWLVGLHSALPIGILTGLLVFIPYVGFSMGFLLALVAALLQPGAGVSLLILTICVYGAGQILESYFLTPRLVGERIGLHPIAVIFALLAFGALFGFVGVLLALPVSAALLVALRHLRKSYVESDAYKG